MHTGGSPTELLVRPRFKPQNDSIPIETTSHRLNIVTSFPLRPRSRDNFLILEQEQNEEFTALLSEDRKVHLKLLQLVSSPSNSEQHFQPSVLSNFDAITPDIINTLDKYQGASPLHYACINGHTFMVKFLLEKGANLNIWDEKKRVTPLACAAAHGHLEIVKTLVESGCDVNAGLNSSNDGQDCALLWAVRRAHSEIVRYLLEVNAWQNSTVTFSETPIHAAVFSGSTEILKMLVNAQDKSVNSDFQMGPEKYTSLHLAASGDFENSFELCRILIEEGNVSINSLNADDKTPLHFAVASQNVEIVMYLLTRFAKVNAPDKDGRTPLFYALGGEEEDLECMQALIDTGKCNVNHQDKWGHTPLHLCGVYSSAASAELLLLNGADFSIKTDSGASALSILLKEIPSTSALLHKAFDQAVTLTQSEESTGKRQNSKVNVDFKYVLPAPTPTTGVGHPPPSPTRKGPKASRFKRMTVMFSEVDVEEDQHAEITRKETTKIKCLVDEDLCSLLLHPVIHSFLELKWQKARRIFLPTLAFRIIHVVLFSIYVLMPYYAFEVTKKPPASADPGKSDGIVFNAINPKPTKGKSPLWLTIMYLTIVVLTALKGVTILAEIILAPKRMLKSVHPWIAWAVLVIMIMFMTPGNWETLCTCDPFTRAMGALGILFAWLDVWIDMAAFPKIGLSIRVFFKVLKNFSYFILPHCCLLIGFVLAFTLLFPESGEFQSLVLGLTKVIRVMAGDITIVSPGQEVLEADTEERKIFSHVLLVYIYTAYVLMVAIVLGNLILGLAVNDIAEIYKDAAVDKLAKQVILLNVLETSFHSKWTGFCISKRIFSKYVNLFSSHGPDDKIKSFNPSDPSDWKLNSERKKALCSIASVNRVSESEKDKRNSATITSLRTKRWAKVAFRKSKRYSRAYADDEERQLMENINKLVLAYVENKTLKT